MFVKVEDVTITFFASFLIWLMFAGVLVLWLLDGRITKEEVLHALLASFTAWVLAEIIKRIFPTLRPYQTDGRGILTMTMPTDGAFPSGHAAASFALALTIWLHDRKLGWIFLVAALVIGIARVLGNVHYPVDILGGAVLGIFVALAVEKLHVFKLFSFILKRNPKEKG